MSTPVPRHVFDRTLVLAALGCSLAALIWPRLQPSPETDLEPLRRELTELRRSLENLAVRPTQTAPSVVTSREQSGPVTLEQLHDWFWALDQRMIGLEARPNPANRYPVAPWQVQQDSEKARRTVLDLQASPDDRLVALRSLRMTKNRTSEVIQAMIALQASSPEGRIRADIFRQLSGVNDPILKAPLIQALRNDPDISVREEAAETLAAFASDPEVRSVLSTAMQHDVNPRVKEQAKLTLESQSAPMR